MLRYPASTPSQQPVLAPLISLVATVPACELWITLTTAIEANLPNMTPGALQNVANIATNVAKVFDYLFAEYPQSVPSAEYLLALSRTARTVAVNAKLAALIANGTVGITITVGAQNALSTLSLWDPVQGYLAPSSPGELANLLLAGVSIA